MSDKQKPSEPTREQTSSYPALPNEPPPQNDPGGRENKGLQEGGTSPETRGQPPKKDG